MTELDPSTELDQASRPRRCGRVGSDPELLGRTPQQAHVAEWLSRRGKQEFLGPDRKRVKPPDEAPLDPAGQRRRLGESEPAGELRRLQPPGQLEQRQRVAARLSDDPVSY